MVEAGGKLCRVFYAYKGSSFILSEVESHWRDISKAVT